MPKQRAELRVVLEAETGDRALIFRVSVSGDDIYMGSVMSGREVLVQSIHASGEGHTKVLPPNGQRVKHPKDLPMAQFSGIRSVWSQGIAFNAITPGYVPKADTRTRRTIVLPWFMVSPASGVDVWLVEPGREAELDTEWARRYGAVSGALRADWTVPNVAVVIVKRRV